MTPETLALIASYFLCSEAAEVRVLSHAEVETCTATYRQVKLSFVELRTEEFEAMSATERAEVNRQGYAAYVDWRATHPELVAQMEAEAKASVMASGF